MSDNKSRMESALVIERLEKSAPPSFLNLPGNAIVEVLKRLDAHSLVNVACTATCFNKREWTGLTLTEHIAQDRVLKLCGDKGLSERFRDISWKERLFIEEGTACGFDNVSAQEGQFNMARNPESSKLQSIRLAGMGPRILVSDLSTKDQSVLRWRLCIKGNTAVEFGIIPADLEHSHTSLHKCASLPGRPAAQSIGFCSAITAGSLLPLSVPIMKGTVLEIIARQGKLDVCLTYPQDAVQVEWHNGVAVEHPYRGPREVRFEQKYPEDYPVRLAITSWAKAQFDILHTLHYDDELNYSCDALPQGRCSASISSGSGSGSPLSHSPPTTSTSPNIMHTPSWRTLFYGAPFLADDQVMDYDGGKNGGMNVDALLQQQLGLGGSGSGGALSSLPSPPQSNTQNAVMAMMMDVDSIDERMMNDDV